ncbi:MAG: glycosyltransferase [Proteobacteria bacterium]|nr:glycosyltransferase [Pseudomonadota bacterium]
MSDTRKPVVLVLASTYPRRRGDPEPGFVHELCRRLAGRFDVIALVPDAPDAEPGGTLDGVEVVRYRYAPRRWQTLVNDGGIVANLRRARWKWLLVPGFIAGQYLAARRLVRRRKVDVVHAHWLLPQGWIARRLRRRHGIPYLVTSHGGDLFGLRGGFATRIKREVAAACAGMTVVSSAMRGECARIGLHPPTLEVLPMGVDLQQRFVPDPAQPRARDKLLFVGRLVPNKGLTHLLAALPAVLAQRPQVRLVVAGFGPEQAALQAQAARLGIADRVEFKGATPQEQLPALYRRASLFVAPFVRDPSGDQEGLPVALMEAIGCGCPVVVGDVAGVHDLLGDAAADVIVRPDDHAAVASAILAALRDPEAAAARARGLRDAAAARVDWQRIATGYSSLLDRCIEHPHSAPPGH